jgi:hypothetical protein
MNRPNFARHEGLAALGARSDAEVRPTLLRILTDLYVQKLKHTAEEERHYTELALRLLPSADAETRRTIARRLTHYPSSPSEVLQRLAKDLPEVASPTPADTLPYSSPTAETAATAASATQPAYRDDDAVTSVRVIDAATARQLNALFLAADAGERRLILRNLEIVAPPPRRQASAVRDRTIGERLEAAVLSRRHEEFTRHLARSLQISREQAQRILRDDLGEPLVIAGKALSIARDTLYRLLLFANPAVGHSVERVHALAALYDEITPQAAEGMVAIWQALPQEDRVRTHNQPVRQDDDRRGDARAAAPTVSTLRRQERRNAS